METYTYTHTHTHTDGRERGPMGLQEGDSPFDTFHILWHFHQRWRFIFGLGLGDVPFPPVHKRALPILVLLSTFSSFILFFFSFLLIACLYLIPPVMGAKCKKQCIRLSFLLLFHLLQIHFLPLCQQGDDIGGCHGHAGRAGGLQARRARSWTTL